jgi:N-formylglutamate amidohydrolase
MTGGLLCRKDHGEEVGTSFMDAMLEYQIDGCAHEVLAPARQRLPIVFASPHSGQNYPSRFIEVSRLSPLELRRSEDSFVDEIFATAPDVGAPLLRALFPRAYVDPNREPFELDPEMFADNLPDYANTRSPRVAAGLGTIARVVASGAEIYGDKLCFSEALDRIRGYYWPYHTALRDLVARTRETFGFCLLIDCHSMPSKGLPGNGSVNLESIDVVLGDAFGRACARAVSDCAERSLTSRGYRVARNNPYSGGFVTRHYGRPGEGVHCLQIELNRKLYMDEARIRRGGNFGRVREDIGELIGDLAVLTEKGL